MKITVNSTAMSNIILKPGLEVSANGTKYQSGHFNPKLTVLDSQSSSLEYRIHGYKGKKLRKKHLALPSILLIWYKNVHSGTLIHRLKLSSQANLVSIEKNI